MSIRPLNKERTKWQIDYYPTGGKGARIREVYEGNEASALQYELEVRRQHYGPGINKVSPKLNDVLPDYFDWLKLHRSAKYYADMQDAFKRLKPFFGNKLLSRINQALVNRYKETRPRPTGRHAAYKGTSAINKELRYLGTVYSWATKEGYCNALPFKIEKLPYQRKPPQFFHPSDLDKLLVELKGPEPERPLKKALILFMFQCGLRWKEASHVRWENIDWTSGMVYLDETKGGRSDSCFLTDDIAKALKPLKREKGWVFENTKTGTPWRSIRNQLVKAAERAGIRHIKPHMMRRTGADLMRRATKDIELVKNYLRHTDIATTQLYLRVDKSEIKAAQRQTADYISQLKATERRDNKKKKK